MLKLLNPADLQPERPVLSAEFHPTPQPYSQGRGSPPAHCDAMRRQSVQSGRKPALAESNLFQISYLAAVDFMQPQCYIRSQMNAPDPLLNTNDVAAVDVHD